MSINTLPANIYTTLSGHSGLSNLVGTRISPLTTGYEGDKPFVVYQQKSEDQFNVLENTGGGGTRKVIVIITSYATTHLEAFSVAEQARQAMRDSTLFASSYQESMDNYNPDTKLYYVISEYSLITS